MADSIVSGESNRLILRGEGLQFLRQQQQHHHHQQAPHPRQADGDSAGPIAAAVAPGIVGAVTFFLVFFVLVAAYWRCRRLRPLPSARPATEKLLLGSQSGCTAGGTVPGGECNITVNPLMLCSRDGCQEQEEKEASHCGIDIDMGSLLDSSSSSSCCADSCSDSDNNDDQEDSSQRPGGGVWRARLASSEDELDDDDEDDDIGGGGVNAEAARLIRPAGH